MCSRTDMCAMSVSVLKTIACPPTLSGLFLVAPRPRRMCKLGEELNTISCACTLDLLYIIDLGCVLLHLHRALSLRTQLSSFFRFAHVTSRAPQTRFCFCFFIFSEYCLSEYRHCICGLRVRGNVVPASVTSRCCLVLSCLVWSHAVVKPNSNYVSQCEHVIHEQEVYVCAADLCKLNLIPRASAVFSLVDEHGCDRKLGFTRRSIFFSSNA